MNEMSLFAALAAAFAAGLLSVLSPCVMPLMPAYLSLISGVSVEQMQEGDVDSGLRRKILVACLGFIGGFSTVFVLMGASATFLGRFLRTWHVDVLGLKLGMTQLAGVIIIIMGMHLIGVIRLRFLYRDHHFHVQSQGMNGLRTYLVGAAFAFGWSPCVGPILGGILTIAGSHDTVGRGMGLLLVYSAGLGVPFLLAGWSIEYFFRSFDKVKSHFRAVEVVSGTLLLGIGFLVMTEQLTRLNNYFLFLNDFVTYLEKGLL